MPAFVAGLYFFLFQYDYLCHQGTGDGVDYQQDDIGLIQEHANVVHLAAVLLEKCQLIKSERSTGHFQSLELGQIVSHYYVTYDSMLVYNQHLCPTMSMAGVVQSVCLVERVQAFTCQFPLSTMVIFSDTLSLRRSIKEFVFLIPMKTKFGSS